MNLNNYENRIDLLVDWILESLPADAAVLDIGANDGSFCPEVRRVAQASRFYAGVDPDVVKLERHPFLNQRFPSTMEDANIPPQSFDTLFAVFVLEHVARDHQFMQAVGRALRPGGSFFFITPNRQHYFALIASLLASGGLQEKVLRAIRPNELIDQYHYPALYRLNTPAHLRVLGRKAGFSSFKFRYSERLDEIAPYFPGPTRAFPWLWEKLVQLSGQERLLLNMMVKMTKET